MKISRHFGELEITELIALIILYQIYNEPQLIPQFYHNYFTVFDQIITILGLSNEG
jgi:hypothetical protein